MRYVSSSGKDVGELLGREVCVTLVVSISSMTAMDGVVGCELNLRASSIVNSLRRPGITENIQASACQPQHGLDSEAKFRIMSGDDRPFAAPQGSSNATSDRQDSGMDGLIHAGDTILLRLPTGDIKSSKLEADSYVAFRIVLIKR